MSLQDFQARVDAMERDREFVAWMEFLHEIDLLAARDPEPDAAKDFAAWVEACQS